MQDEPFNPDDWEPVTDPDVVKKYMGVAGVNKMGADTGGDDPVRVMPNGLKVAQMGNWNKARAAMKTLKNLNELRAVYEKDFGESGPAGLADYLPAITSKKNSSFDTQVQALLAPIKSATRGPSEGTFTDKDLEALEKLVPSRWRNDAGNRTTMQEMDEYLRGHVDSGFGMAQLSTEDINRAIKSYTYTPEGTNADPNEILNTMKLEGKTPKEIADFLVQTGADPAYVESQMPAITEDRNYRFANPQGPEGKPLVIPRAPPSTSGARPDLATVKSKWKLD